MLSTLNHWPCSMASTVPGSVLIWGRQLPSVALPPQIKSNQIKSTESELSSDLWITALASLWSTNTFLLSLNNGKSPCLPLSKVTRYFKISGRDVCLTARCEVEKGMDTYPFLCITKMADSYLNERGKEVFF